MKHARLTSLVLSGLLLAAPVFPVLAQAKIGAGLTQAATAGGYATNGTPELTTVVGRLIQISLTLVGALLLLYLIYAGFLWMTAQGDEKQVKSAKDTIRNAIIGLVIIASAYAIANFVLVQLTTNVFGGTATK